MLTRFPGSVVLTLAALWLVSLVGCGTATHAVRTETDQDGPLVFTARSGEQPVELRAGELEVALAGLVRDVRPASNPVQHARRLMLESLWHEDVYLKWTGRRLELDSEAQAAQQTAQECLELTHPKYAAALRRGLELLESIGYTGK